MMINQSTSSMFSATSETISSEMKMIKQIRNEDPASAQKIFQLGEQLVLAARNGELSRFRRLCISNTNTSDKSCSSEMVGSKILIYFVTKAFQEALLNDHLMLATFIVQNGFPIKQQIGFPNFLQECLSVLDDLRCVPVINFFVNNSQSSGGFDINYQAVTTWLTPLHIAVRRLLSETVQLLISFGADVNAVAEGDLMPLTALQAVVIADGDNDSMQIKEKILDMLIKSGAKATWRRGIIGGSDATMLPSHSSSVAVAAGGSPPGFSTISGSFSSSSSGSRIDSNAVKKVRFTGGGGPIPLSNDNNLNIGVTIAKGEVENEVSSVFTTLRMGGDLEEAVAASKQAEVGPVVTVSDDGGMLFSTGS